MVQSISQPMTKAKVHPWYSMAGVVFGKDKEGHTVRCLKHQFKVRLKKITEDGAPYYFVDAPAFQGVLSQGQTMKDALKMIIDALECSFEAYRNLGETFVPAPISEIHPLDNAIIKAVTVLERI